MRTIPEVLRRPPSFEASSPLSDELAWVIEGITPMLGGGVESFDPDTHDIVRVPSIRGALRWWWRVLGDEAVDALRDAERRVWGGIGDGGEGAAQASRVWVLVTDVAPGRVLPAGRHEMRRDGRLAVLPSWSGGRELGYGLFPLQRQSHERMQWQGRDAMPTKSWREGVRFTLRIRFDPKLAVEERERVIKAVTLWVTLGGYGARARRGFGALASPSVKPETARRLVLDAMKRAAITERPNLGGSALFSTPARFATALDAHRALLGALMHFRQGVGFARNPGTEPNRPGRSRWPEPDSLRNLTKRWEPRHAPDPSAKGVPRAAFGLPLGVSFKDHGDLAASAMIIPSVQGEKTQRWASPVILRPVRDGSRYRAVVLRLAGHTPSHVTAHGRSVEVRSVAGAKGEIGRLLRDARGDAAVAFTDWLCEQGDFERERS